jgi:hypothetical protein
MKTSSSLFFLVILSLSAFSAHAAGATEETAVVRLPTYVIEAPRQTPAEQAIKRSLDALRAVAAKPMVVKIAPPFPEVKNSGRQPEPKSPASAVVVAGL